MNTNQLSREEILDFIAYGEDISRNVRLDLEARLEELT